MAALVLPPGEPGQERMRWGEGSPTRRGPESLEQTIGKDSEFEMKCDSKGQRASMKAFQGFSLRRSSLPGAARGSSTSAGWTRRRRPRSSCRSRSPWWPSRTGQDQRGGSLQRVLLQPRQNGHQRDVAPCGSGVQRIVAAGGAMVQVRKICPPPARSGR